MGCLDGVQVASLEGHTANITALAYSAQGKWLVTILSHSKSCIVNLPGSSSTTAGDDNHCSG